MSKINTAYSKLRRQYLTDKPVCHAKIHKCSVQATDVHHMHGRGIYHLDTKIATFKDIMALLIVKDVIRV